MPSNALQITDPNASDNPLYSGTPSQGEALGSTVSTGVDRLGQWLAEQRAKSSQMGLWNDRTGMPTSAGVVNAAQQYGGGLLMGTTAPGTGGFTAYHGSPASFERFDSSYLHPDEAGHYFAQNEQLAQDYAGRSASDPNAGHMYQVNIKADPSQFLDYGSLHPTDQAALNAPGAVQKLVDAGVPGVKFPNGTYAVFDAKNIDILRKYGIAGLLLGGSAAAGSQQSQQ